MSQQSKLRQSRQQWKHKAKERADQNRYLRKALERLRNERDRAKQALKKANKQLRQKEARPTHLKAHRVWLTLTLFARAHISFRAVSRVLHVLADWLGIGPVPPNRHQLGDAPIGCAHAIGQAASGRCQAPKPLYQRIDLDD